MTKRSDTTVNANAFKYYNGPDTDCIALTTRVKFKTVLDAVRQAGFHSEEAAAEVLNHLVDWDLSRGPRNERIVSMLTFNMLYSALSILKKLPVNSDGNVIDEKNWGWTEYLVKHLADSDSYLSHLLQDLEEDYSEDAAQEPAALAQESVTEIQALEEDNKPQEPAPTKDASEELPEDNWREVAAKIGKDPQCARTDGLYVAGATTYAAFQYAGNIDLPLWFMRLFPTRWTVDYRRTDCGTVDELHLYSYQALQAEYIVRKYDWVIYDKSINKLYGCSPELFKKEHALVQLNTETENKWFDNWSPPQDDE